MDPRGKPPEQKYLDIFVKKSEELNFSQIRLFSICKCCCCEIVRQ